MKKIYGIMLGGELVNSCLERWKAQEYCEIMNAVHKSEIYQVKEFVLLDGEEAHACKGNVFSVLDGFYTFEEFLLELGVKVCK